MITFVRKTSHDIYSVYKGDQLVATIRKRGPTWFICTLNDTYTAPSLRAAKAYVRKTLT